MPVCTGARRVQHHLPAHAPIFVFRTSRTMAGVRGSHVCDRRPPSILWDCGTRTVDINRDRRSKWRPTLPSSLLKSWVVHRLLCPVGSIHLNDPQGFVTGWDPFFCLAPARLTVLLVTGWDPFFCLAPARLTVLLVTGWDPFFCLAPARLTVLLVTGWDPFFCLAPARLTIFPVQFHHLSSGVCFPSDVTNTSGTIARCLLSPQQIFVRSGGRLHRPPGARGIGILAGGNSPIPSAGGVAHTHVA